MNTMDSNPLRALADQVRQPTGFGPPEAVKVQERSANSILFFGGLVQFVYNGLVFVLSLFTVPAEVFLRCNFGERYLTLPRMALGYLLIALYWNFTGLIGGAFSRQSLALGGIGKALSAAYVLACLVHFGSVAVRKLKGVRCYSRYAGDSLLPWRRLPFYDAIGGQYNVQLYGEPLLLIALHFVLKPFVPQLGVFFLLCGVSLLVKGYAQHAAFRQRVLDTVDRQIEAEQLGKAVSEWKDPAGLATEGYVIPSYLRQRPAEQRRERIKTAKKAVGLVGPLFRKLDAALDGLLEEESNSVDKHGGVGAGSTSAEGSGANHPSTPEPVDGN